MRSSPSTRTTVTRRRTHDSVQSAPEVQTANRRWGFGKITPSCYTTLTSASIVFAFIYLVLMQYYGAQLQSYKADQASSGSVKRLLANRNIRLEELVDRANEKIRLLEMTLSATSASRLRLEEQYLSIDWRYHVKNHECDSSQAPESTGMS